MQFLSPLVLWALAALSIPVIIHLFRFRRFKTFYFSQVKWLQALTQERKATRQLKHILILSSRLLALLFLILAFAQPVFRSDKMAVEQSKHVAIFIDNSQSMMGGDGQQTAWSVAQEAALNLIQSYPPDYRFRILTHTENPGEYNWRTRDESVKAIQGVRLTYGSLTWNQVAEKLRYATESHPTEVVVFSDFQSDGANVVDDWPVDARLVQTSPSGMPDNISLDTLYFSNPPTRPGQTLEIEVVLTNHGESEVKDVHVQLELNDSFREGQRVDLASGETKRVTLSTLLRKKGFHTGRVRIDDFPLTFDDDLYFSFRLRDNIPVVLIQESDGPLDKLYADEVFDTKVFSPGNVALSVLREADLIVLNAINEIPQGLANAIQSSGASVFLVMPEKISASVGSFLSLMGIPEPTSFREEALPVTEIDWDDPLFYGVFAQREERPKLPEIKSSWQFPSVGLTSVLTFADGRPFIFRVNANQSVFVQASTLKPFSTDPLFLPIYHNAALYAKGSQQPYGIIGEEVIRRYAVVNESKPLHIMIDGKEHLPSQRRIDNQTMQMRRQNTPNKPGNFPLMAGSDTVDIISLNADRQESRYPRMSTSEIEDTFGASPLQVDIKNQYQLSGIMTHDGGSSIWWWGMLLVAMFLITELVLIRFLP
ncbi:MAG: BatA domain-containing protein [Cryomorphaceae bacterium]|nr:BatA domain-containing protein [Cryomorphaceae bacterium]